MAWSTKTGLPDPEMAMMRAEGMLDRLFILLVQDDYKILSRYREFCKGHLRPAQMATFDTVTGVW